MFIVSISKRIIYSQEIIEKLKRHKYKNNIQLIENNDTVYFIDIGVHKDIYDEIKLLEIIDNNWGFLLNDKLKGVSRESLQSNELKVLRNNN